MVKHGRGKSPRRQLAGGILALLMLAACARPERNPVVQTVVVRETVVQEVIKEVQQTIEVITEKIVEVTPTPPGGAQVTLHWSLTGEPATLDPGQATDASANDIVQNLFAGLTSFDAQGNVLPDLAASWRASEDGLTYTFSLRHDAVWVNYKPAQGLTVVGPVTASDVIYAVRRACDPRTGSSDSALDYGIAGCQAAHRVDTATISDAELDDLVRAVGVTAPDTYTVQFNLTAPAAYFPVIAGLSINRPQPQAVIEEYGARWIEPGFIVTNGPYVLASWFHGESLTLQKNPYWFGWSAAPGNIERVEAAILSDPGAALRRYESGALDTLDAPLGELARLQEDSTFKHELSIAPIACTYYLGFTNTKPPMDNVLVRKALAAAIDRQILVETVIGGGQIPAGTLAPAMIFGNAAEDPAIAPWALSKDQGGWGYNRALKQAQSWLAEAGYPKGQGLPPISLMYNTSEGHARIAEAIQHMWQEGLGITVTLQSQEWPLFQDTIRNGKPPDQRPHVFRMGWCASYPDENNALYDSFNTDAGENTLSWDADANAPLGPDGKSFNQLTLEARQSLDPVRRKEIYAAAEKIVSDDVAAYAPLFYYSAATLAKPYLQRTFFVISGQRLATWVLDQLAKNSARAP